jgi:hypothetical protein
MRQEEMPEPVDMKKMNQSSLHDDELDLTLIDDTQIENSNTNAQIEHQINHFQTHQSNSQEAAKSSIVNASEHTAKSSQQQSSSSENHILKKILEKIKKQREEITHKASQLNQDESLDSTGPLPVDEQIDPLQRDQDEKSIQLGSRITNDRDEEGDFDEDERDCISLVLNSEMSESHLSKQDKENIRNIMMSSHNVSSLMIDNNNRNLLNVKMNNRIRSRAVAGGDPTGNAMGNRIDLRNTGPAYSVDLSHASREPILAGTKEIFNKNVSAYVLQKFEI